ncbi:MAG: ABC transporter permease [Desulfuromonadales bacterium]|nr:ABC transporter permease [Desulfuromonadales bacterium]
MQSFSIAPATMLSKLWFHRRLIFNLTRREVVGRYRGSVLGLLWSFFNPIFMLAVYTFVFSVVLNAKWGTGGGSKAEFALILFAGLLVFNLFAECVSRAPGLILSNPSYVKKVVFPLEILPWVILGSALFHLAVSVSVWLLFSLWVYGLPPLTALLFPLMLLPLILLVMGLSWFLAALGVYLRDVAQIVGIVVTALMFLTPIFYPVSIVPEDFRRLIYLNPLTFIVDQVRSLLIFGGGLDLSGYALLCAGSLLVCWLGFAWFQLTRKGFADVV